MDTLTVDQKRRMDNIRSGLEKKKVVVTNLWLENILRSMGAFASATTIDERHVYRKWLNCDLAAMNKSKTCISLLPSRIFSRRSTIIDDEITVQVNEMMDISKPPIDNTNDFLHIEEDDTEGFSGEEKENKTYKKATANSKPLPGRSQHKVKAPRMVMLQLTDGVQTVKAIEYEPINCFANQLAKGCKLLLSGSIQVHNSVLLLKSSNVEVLGGEVGDLAIERQSCAELNVTNECEAQATASASVTSQQLDYEEDVIWLDDD
ncbi:RecQ-mediated genome instability protein 1 [Halotydeus destructor]|nr:RecQ-mediated genome instability protein 1 [Halotydeus destructor]